MRTELKRLNGLVEYMSHRNTIVQSSDILDNGDWTLVIYYPADWKPSHKEYNEYTRDYEEVYQQRITPLISKSALRNPDTSDDELYAQITGAIKQAYDELKFIKTPFSS